MGQIEQSATTSYQVFKHTLDTELKKTAEGFVRIGYLLKVARDTEVLQESGYKNVTEFAAAEYGLTKDVVSRYIAINDRYSQDGYSEYLQEKYSSYGVAKLAEMLTLPDSVIESLSPLLTRIEIQEIKKEVKEEEQISDIEVMLEPKNSSILETNDLLAKAMYQYCHDKRITYLALSKAVDQDEESAIIESLLDVLAPSGYGVEMLRVPGTGKLMLSIGEENNIEVLNIRTNEKASYKWQQFIAFLKTFCPESKNAKAQWESIYGEAFEEKKEKIPEPKKAMAEQVLATKEEGAAKPTLGTVHETGKGKIITDTLGPITQIKENDTQLQENDTENTKVAPVQPEEQLPGQKKIEDYPEYLPENNNSEEIITTEKGQEVIIDQGSRDTQTMEVTVHEIKCYQEFFKAAAEGKKNFELRFNDRNYKTGDVLKQREVDGNGGYTGRYLEQQVIYMLEEFAGLEKGYCILGVELLSGVEEE